MPDEHAPPPSLHIRRLLPHEWPIYKHVRLAALKDAPSAFESTFAGASALTDADWQSRTIGLASPDTKITLIGVNENGEAVALGTCMRIQDEADGEVPTDTNRCMLVSMWVRPEVRGKGLGRMIVQHALEWVESIGGAVVELSVSSGNEAGLRLYESMGFRLTGELEANGMHPDLPFRCMEAEVATVIRR